MRRFLLTLIPAFALTLAACDSKPEVDPQVAKAAEIAKAIDASPDDAEKVLKDNSMSVEDFEAMMLDIASDPAKSEAFQQARAG